MAAEQMKELHNAVYETQTNWILKKLIYSMRYIPKYGQSKASKLIKLLQIDISKCEPIYFNGQAYKKSEHENNYFLFIDNEFKLMGILLGNSWDKDFEDIEQYEWTKPYSYGDHIKKNRKNLTEGATHILMFTPEMKVKRKAKPRPVGYKNQKDYKRELESRLSRYKKEKYDSLTIEDCQNIIREAIAFFTNKLWTLGDRKAQYKYVYQFRNPIWYANDISDCIRWLAEQARELQDKIDEFERIKARGLNVEMYSSWTTENLRSLKVYCGQIKKRMEEVK